MTEKLKLLDRKLTKKGKSGKQIMNLDVNEARKRKRFEAFKEEATSAIQNDKVWFPPEDLNLALNPVPTKELVPVEN